MGKGDGFTVENIFTRQDYEEFRRAVEQRRPYDFIYSAPGTYLPNPKTGMYFYINGRECDNGIWKDDYLYGIDCMRGNEGCGRGYDPVDEILTYEEIVAEIYQGLHLTPPQTRQMSIFDMEM
jgi:hypothetical protein